MQHPLIRLHLQAACAPFHLLGRVATPNCCYPATSQSALRLPLIGIAILPTNLYTGQGSVHITSSVLANVMRQVGWVAT